MRRLILARRLIFAVCLLTLFGCSGLTTLVVINNVGEDATVRLWTMEDPKRQRKEKDKTLQMEHGDREESLKWFRDPPKQITLEATWAKGSIKKSWTDATYPPAMSRGSSGLGMYILEIGPSGALIRKPNIVDKFYYDPGPFLLLLCPIAVVALVIWVVVRAHRNSRRPVPASDPQ